MQTEKFKCCDDTHTRPEDCIHALLRNVHRGEWPEDIMRVPLSSVLERTRCFSMDLRTLITRLRRGAIPGDWEFFKGLVEDNLDYLLEVSDSRTLISILDTYVDHAGPIEQKNALLAISMISYEKLVKTKEAFFAMTPRTREEADLHRAMWSGMAGFLTDTGDMPYKLFRRYREVMRDTPHIKRMFARIMREMLEHPASTPAVLAELSGPGVRFRQAYLRFLCDMPGGGEATK